MKSSQFLNTVFAYYHDSDTTQPAITKRTYNKQDVPDGYGAFFSVNGFADGVRQKTHLSNVNAVHVDIDKRDVSLQDLQMETMEYLAPSIINETKNGFHCFWLLDDAVLVNESNRDRIISTVEGINRRLVKLFKGDKAAVDVTRVLRIPGTEHRKDIKNPFVITTVYETDDVYTLDELEVVFEPIDVVDVVPTVSGTLTEDAEKMLRKMLKKEPVAALYGGDTSAYDDDVSSADLALCNHLAFWLQKDIEVMRSVWLSSPLGQREKTQKRVEYQNSTLQRAIDNCENVYDPGYKEETLGVDVGGDVTSTRERDEYLSWKDAEDWDDKDWVKELKRRQTAYAQGFHHYFAIVHPHFLFERGEDKVYWNYNEKTGIYDEMTAVSAKEVVMRLLMKEDMRQYVRESFAKDVLASYRSASFEHGVVYDDFDENSVWFHARNGWVNTKTLEFEPHTHKRLSRRCSAVDYDADAECPTYDKFLDSDLRLKEDQVRVIDQFSGLSLTNNIQHQKMLTILGRPGSGKSTLLNVWSLVLGDMVAQKKLTELSSESFRFAGSSLLGKSLCWFDEVDVKKAEMGNSLGVLITGEHINVERKGINGILMGKNTLKCVLTANSLPLSSEHGMYRRIIIIQLDGSFHDDGTIILDMPQRLEAEASGILNRMLVGLSDLRKMGTFTVISGHEQLIEDYKTDSNITSEFLDTYFTSTTDEDERILTGDLFTAFTTFTGNKTHAISSPQRFGQTLKTQPLNKFSRIRAVKSNGKRYWIGLKLKDEYSWNSYGEIEENLRHLGQKSGF